MAIVVAGAATMMPHGGTTATIARRATVLPFMAMTEVIAQMTAIIAATIIATSGVIATNGDTRSAACTITIAVGTGAARSDPQVTERRYRCAR